MSKPTWGVTSASPVNEPDGVRFPIVFRRPGPGPDRNTLLASVVETVANATPTLPETKRLREALAKLAEEEADLKVMDQRAAELTAAKDDRSLWRERGAALKLGEIASELAGVNVQRENIKRGLTILRQPLDALRDQVREAQRELARKECTKLFHAVETEWKGLLMEVCTVAGPKLDRLLELTAVLGVFIEELVRLVMEHVLKTPLPVA